jgi:hypothetical protein
LSLKRIIEEIENEGEIGLLLLPCFSGQLGKRPEGNEQVSRRLSSHREIFKSFQGDS